METLCGTFTPFGNSAREEWSEYMMCQDAEVYNDKEKLMRMLEELCKVPSNAEEGRFIYNDGNGERYLAAPVMMALLLKEYKLAEDLMDAGYFADDRILDAQVVSMQDLSGEWSYQEVFVTQLLLARVEIPDGLFHKICEQLSVCRPVFSFNADYWSNPFLQDGEYRSGRRVTIPYTKGLDRIYESRPELLEGFLDCIRENQFCDWWIAELNNEERNKLAHKLLKYVQGYELDFFAMLKLLTFEPREIHMGKKNKALRDWINLLFKMKEIYEDCREIRIRLFHYLIQQYIVISGEKSFLDETFWKECCKELTDLIRRSRPKDYDFEEYLEFVVDMDRQWEAYPEYLEVWRKYVRQPMKLERMNDHFWNMVTRVIGCVKAVDMDDDFDFNELLRDYNREERIKTCITLMELPLRFTTPYKNRKAERESLAVLFGAILDFGSEELAIACMKNGLIPGEVLPTLISGAISLAKIKIVPAMIAHQNIQKKEEV